MRLWVDYLAPTASAQAVMGGCDVGAAFDGDADCCLLVDETGGLIDGGKIMAVCAAYPQLLINKEVPHSGGVKEKITDSQELAETVKREEDGLAGVDRVLVRTSGTEALIRVMMEAKTTKIAQNTADSLVSHIKSLKI